MKKPPRRKPAPPPPRDEDEDEALELVGTDASDDEEDVDEELEELRQELGEAVNSGRVVVHKVVANGDPQRCFSCPLSQFFSDSIREQWGPGTYSYMVYVRNKLRTRGRISFAEPVKAPGTAAPDRAGVQVPGAPTLADLEARVEQRLEREQARQFELLKLLTGNRPPPPDPLQMQQQLLAMLSTVKELTGGGGGDRSSIDLFLEGVKTAHRFAGSGEGGGTDWGAIVASVVEGAKALAVEPRIPVRRLPAPQASSTNGVTPAAAAATEATEEDADMMGKFKTALQFLVRKAQAGADAELYADVALDNIHELPAFVQPIVLDYIHREDCLDRLIQLEPSIAAHREWFGTVVAEIRRVISERSGVSTLTEEPPPPDSRA